MIAAFILEILSLLGIIGVYLLHFFTTRKIGMLRWVNYYVNRWQKTYPTEAIIAAAAIIIVLVCALLFRSYARRRSFLSVKSRIRFFAVLIPAAVYLYCMVSMSVKNERAYFFMLLTAALSTLLQVIKNLLLLHRAGFQG